MDSMNHHGGCDCGCVCRPATDWQPIQDLDGWMKQGVGVKLSKQMDQMHKNIEM